MNCAYSEINEILGVSNRHFTYPEIFEFKKGGKNKSGKLTLLYYLGLKFNILLIYLNLEIFFSF